MCAHVRRVVADARRSPSGQAQSPVTSTPTLKRQQVVVEESAGQQCRRKAQDDLAGQWSLDQLLDARESIAHGPHADAEYPGGGPQILASGQVRLHGSEKLGAVARGVEDRPKLALDSGTEQPLIGQERTLKQQVIGRVTAIEAETLGDEVRIKRCIERTGDRRQVSGWRRLDGEPAVRPREFVEDEVDSSCSPLPIGPGSPLST